MNRHNGQLEEIYEILCRIENSTDSCSATPKERVNDLINEAIEKIKNCLEIKSEG